MNKKILKLENNKEYFEIRKINENNITYLLLINVDNEFDSKIVKKVTVDGEDYIIELEQGDILVDLKSKFKSQIEKDKNIYS